jgi:hypothetical protein
MFEYPRFLAQGSEIHHQDAATPQCYQLCRTFELYAGEPCLSKVSGITEGAASA